MNEAKEIHLPPGLGPMAGPDEMRMTINWLIEYLAARDKEGEEAEFTVVNISGELPVHTTKKYNTRNLADIRQVVWHHVGTKTGAPVTAVATARYHVSSLDWPGIAYHFFISRNGTAFQTNDLKTVSYHCAGSCNTISIGVCLDGSFIDGRVPTEEQLVTARALNAYLLNMLPGISILQHKQVRRTTCPGTTVDQWWDEILPAT